MNKSFFKPQVVEAIKEFISNIENAERRKNLDPIM